jgi:hypothetical protein
MRCRSISILRIFVTLMSLVLVAGLAGPASAGTLDPKDSCKKGGWRELVRADGTPFANQGECVSYVAAEGGVPEPIPNDTPTLQVTLNSGPFGGCQWSFSGSGFAPSTTYRFDRYVGDSLWFSQNYAVDSGGNIFVGGGANTGLSSFQVKAYALDNPTTPVAVSNLGICPPL